MDVLGFNYMNEIEGEKDYFANLIVGQKEARRKMSFLLDGYYATGYCPPLLLVSARGHGKSSLMEHISKHLYIPGTKTIKPYIPLNAASFKTVDDFFNQVVIPHLIDKYAIVAIDEISGLSEELQILFLSLLNLTNNNQTSFNHNGEVYTFGKKISWIFSTTNLEALSDPLQDRLTVIQLTSYSGDELAEILIKSLANIKIKYDLAKTITDYTRGTPRCIQKISKSLQGYLKRHNKSNFNEHDWRECIDQLGIKKYGIEPLEIDILKTIKNQPYSLTKLAATLCLDRSSLQSAHEKYLLRKQMIQIDCGKRAITQKGREFLEKE